MLFSQVVKDKFLKPKEPGFMFSDTRNHALEDTVFFFDNSNKGWKLLTEVDLKLKENYAHFFTFEVHT